MNDATQPMSSAAGAAAAPIAIATAEGASADLATRLLATTLFGYGLLIRLLPFAFGPQAYLQRYPSEDGYFMLMFARNIARGLGMSSAAGTMPTNGTQPLMTLLWSPAYMLVNGDRTLGVALVLVMELGIALAAWVAMRLLCAKLFDGTRHAAVLITFAPAFWFAAPMTVEHSMNCLETGAYALCVLLVANALVPPRREPGLQWTWRKTLGFGLLLGLTFLVRNDAAFLIGASCLVCLRGNIHGFVAPTLRERFKRVLAMGSVSVVVASPWLAYNYFGFGHIMPVSGRAEALTGHLFGNLIRCATPLLEYISTALTVPSRFEHELVPNLAQWAVLIGLAVVMLRATWTLSEHVQILARMLGLFAVGLLVFYGTYFGAPWFLSRYFFPLSPFLCIAMLAGLCTLIARAPQAAAGRWLAASSLLVVVLVTVGARNYYAHREHAHFHVVRWVQENVPESTWVGAIQTGTLGYFHDRTINLDGKVNEAAYQAALRKRPGEYVVNGPVQYLVDWEGMTTWMTNPVIAANFDVLISDVDQDLGVLKRK